MKRVTIITGPRASGKTTLAGNLLRNNLTCVLDQMDLLQNPVIVQKYCNFILIEELVRTDSVDKIIAIINAGEYSFETPLKGPFICKDMSFVITSNGCVKYFEDQLKKHKIEFNHFKLR